MLHLLSEAEGEFVGTRRGWESCKGAVRGPTRRTLEVEYVDPYLADYRRAMAGYADLARAVASVESALGL